MLTASREQEPERIEVRGEVEKKNVRTVSRFAPEKVRGPADGEDARCRLVRRRSLLRLSQPESSVSVADDGLCRDPLRVGCAVGCAGSQIRL